MLLGSAPGMQRCIIFLGSLFWLALAFLATLVAGDNCHLLDKTHGGLLDEHNITHPLGNSIQCIYLQVNSDGSEIQSSCEYQDGALSSMAPPPFAPMPSSRAPPTDRYGLP
ncbi:hypothetical protein DFH09DRAFT_1310114 [Mycena vulgaris]|nr:hypothetical protein DFH09DRAFT_1327600 [Mycena vulgaris]KAJ6580169.1 hypothetical protein DFH09DRAFT_1310114 [Mycena vulgaris]